MTKHRITIKELAKELKISTSTVSRALADKWDVNPETRKAVLELAERWNYHPNPISLSLKQQQTMTIGVVIPEFMTSFFPEVIVGIQTTLEAEGYSVLISQSDESYEKEIKNIKNLEARFVDGLIVSLTKETVDTGYLESLLNRHMPLVLFNRVCDKLDTPKVTIDDCKWAFEAVEHLINQGYKRIIHLTGPENLELSKQRKKGYIDALTKHNIPIDPELIIPCGVMMEKGVIAAHRILEMKELPDAIFAINDPVAIGAMKTLQKNGIRIPEDIGVVGFSESKMAVIVEPNLTSVEQPTFDMGKIAAELLLEQLKNKKDEAVLNKCITLNAKLNIRESSLRKF